MLTCLFLLTSALNAQSRTVTISNRTTTIKDALQEIEMQTDYVFAIGHSNFDMDKIVSLTDTLAPIRVILNELLKGTEKTFRIIGEQILIIPVSQSKKSITSTKGYTPLFDWSQSYGNEQFEKDILEDRKRRVEKEILRKDAVSYETEIPSETDTVYSVSRFTYPAKVIIVSNPKNEWQQLNHSNLPFKMAIKSNLLYAFSTLTPNLGIEAGVGKKTTLELNGSYNWRNLNGTARNNKKIVHWTIMPEFRYWLCERFNGHYFGVHAFYWQYNISGHNVPFMFEKKYQYEGHAIGMGISYGYHWMLNRRWGIEGNIGIGGAYMDYKKYDCVKCGDKEGDYTKTYFGPTRVGIKLVFFIY